MNPFSYRAREVAKALVALLSSVIALLGLAAVLFADGPLSDIGTFAAAAAMALNPYLVFAKRAESAVDSALPVNPASESTGD